MTKSDIAKICHEANRALCETQGLPPEQKLKDYVFGAIVGACIKSGIEIK